MMRNTVLITGVDGNLGGKLTRQLLEKTNFNILGLTLSQELTDMMIKREGLTDLSRVTFLNNDEFLESDRTDWGLYGAVHLAFSRRMQPAADIASSITFAARVFHKLKDCGADRVIYVSSQGIYGNTEEIRTEEMPPAPGTQYTMAKYAAEVLFDDILRDVPHHTKLRLDLVAQSQNVVKGLCSSAKQGKISLTGGGQVFSFLDAEDAASAIAAMLTAEGDWASVYNVGWNRKRYTLVELAEIIADAAVRCGYPRPEITLEKKDIALWAGMDSSRFMEKTGWAPQIEIGKTIEGIIMS